MTLKPTQHVQAHINSEWIDVTDKCRQYGSMADRAMNYAIDNRIKTRLIKITIMVEFGKQYERIK